MHRFKTKCERFLAADLRDQINVRTRKAEEVLTTAAARYLFDEGLNPLFSAPVVKLRPDLFDSQEPYSLYVEAKQYTKAPRQTVLRAAWQVWDTWSELDGQHAVREAFLLIFRRSGPLVVFEGAPARLGDRTLHPVLIDISEI